MIADKNEHLKECEKENQKKRKKYIRERLKEIMRYFDLLSREQQNGIVYFFYDYITNTTENEDMSHSFFFNEIIKNKNIETIQKILQYLMRQDNLRRLVASLIEIGAIYNKEIRPIELSIEAAYTRVPLYCIQGLSPEKIAQYKLYTCLEHSLFLFEKWLELIGKNDNFSKLALNEFFFKSLFNFFQVSLENVYYPRGLDKETKRHINKIIVHELNNIASYLTKQKRKCVSFDCVEILYSFLSLLEQRYTNENSVNIEVEFDSFIEEEIMSQKPLIYNGIPEAPPKFKDVPSLKKKDNLYQEKQERIDILIDVLNMTNEGIIIDKVEEMLGVLYQAIYILKEKVNSELISTKLNRIVNWYEQGLNDESIPKKDINFFNQYLKPIINNSYGKKEDYDNIVFNRRFFLDILEKVSSNPNYEEINSEIIKIIHSFQAISRKIMKLLEIGSLSNGVDEE